MIDDKKIEEVVKEIKKNLEKMGEVGYGNITVEMKNYKIFVDTTFKNKF